MTRRFKRGLRWVIMVGCLALAGAGAYYHQVIGPKRVVSRLDLSQAHHSPAELRKVYHAAIRWGHDHDALLGLIGVGDDSSVSHLIRCLENMPDPCGCSKNHCIDALEIITGEDFGDDVEEWKRWAASP
jgi:hypothetical protein